MRSGLRRLAGTGLAVLGALGTAALSRAPQPGFGSSAGLVRLSWSGRPDRVEVCREVSADEQAALPAHMRQAVVCEGRSAEYRLTVVTDGDTVMDEAVFGGGVRHDRPVYLYREISAAPGPHRLLLRFARVDSAPGDPAGARPLPGAARARLDQFPPLLTLDTTVVLQPSRVVLVTFRPERQALIAEGGP